MLDRLRRDPGLALVLCALAAAVVVYAPTIGRGLVGYDDTYMIADNWIVRHPSWSSVKTILFDLHSAKRFTLSPEYLPVRDLSTMLDWVVWDDWYPGHHLTNLGIYLAAIALWFGALTAFGIDRTVVGLAMLVWALHPTHAESVAWLAERKGLLGVMFAGATALGYARFRAGHGGGWLALAMTCAVLAVWSKAPAAFAVASLPALELALPARRVSPRRSLVGLAALGVVGAAAFVPVLSLALGSSVVGMNPHTGGRVATVLGVHGFDLRLALMAIKNAVSYPIATVGPSGLELVLGGVGLVVAVAVALAPRRRAWSPPDVVRAGAVLWLAGWLPASHLILPLQMIVVADRYLLLPTLGFALVVAALVRRVPNVRLRQVLIGAVLLASVLRTLDAQSTWRDATSLWGRAVEANPDDGEAWSAYSEALADTGLVEKAAEATALGLTHSRAPRLLQRRALLLLANGERAEGTAAMREAAVAGEPRAMSNLALLLLGDGHEAEALDWARKGASAMPMYLPAQRALGKVALGGGLAPEAQVAFARAYELDPTSATNRYNLALALLALHRDTEARVQLETVASDPQLGPAARALLARPR